MFDWPRPTPRVITAIALTAVVANTVIVVTGALVRLTGSGLGCPTWPKCTSSSLVNTRAYGIHGVIEFTNRMLTSVLAVVVVACIVATTRRRPRRTDLIGLSWALLAGVVGQALLGGLTVLTRLNPWTVMAHFLLSMVLIATALALYVRAAEPRGRVVHVAQAGLRRLGQAVVAATGVVLVLGTIVTGSGPHAGDRDVARNGFDPATMSQLHTDAVMLLIGLTVATVIALRISTAPGHAQRAAVLLVLTELAQGAVGFVQYFTGLPVALVAVHVLGACLVWLAALSLLFALGAPVPGAKSPAPPAVNATPGAAPAR